MLPSEQAGGGVEFQAVPRGVGRRVLLVRLPSRVSDADDCCNVSGLAEAAEAAKCGETVLALDWRQFDKADKRVKPHDVHPLAWLLKSYPSGRVQLWRTTISRELCANAH